MSCRWIALCVLLLAVAVLCSCVGYFHYHPVKSTEEMRAKKAGGEIFSVETMDTLDAPGLPVISAETIEEETLIK